jgi:hypothetical protein
VGEWVTKRYGKGGVSSQVQKLGMRVVCAPCADWIDAAPRIREIRQWAIIGLLLLLLGILLLMGAGFSGRWP